MSANLAIDSTSKEVLPYRQNYYWDPKLFRNNR
jgi:hypothetical protein